MKIAVLETGRVPQEMTAEHGTYFGMFDSMLKQADPQLEIDCIPVIDGVFPDDPAAYQGYVITGSKFGVYEDHQWIRDLFGFIRATAKKNIPQAGICFGHQAMAQAFGGKVVKSDKGWGCGVHTYQMIAKREWMAPDLPRTAIAAMHQDQVVKLPAGAEILGGSHFCPYGILSYSQGPAMSFQYHPEFTTSYDRDLIEARRGTRIPEAVADIGLASLSTEVHRGQVGQWITRFLNLGQSVSSGI